MKKKIVLTPFRTSDVEEGGSASMHESTSCSPSECSPSECSPSECSLVDIPFARAESEEDEEDEKISKNEKISGIGIRGNNTPMHGFSARNSSDGIRTSPKLEESGWRILEQIASFLSLEDAGTIHATYSWESTHWKIPPRGKEEAPTPSSPENELPEIRESVASDETARSAIQQRLRHAVFTFPGSIRSYCLDAHLRANKKRRSFSRSIRHRERWYGEVVHRCSEVLHEEDPETLREPVGKTVYVYGRRRSRSECRETHFVKQHEHERLLRMLLSKIFRNIPLSVLLHLSESTFDTSIETAIAGYRLTSTSIRSLLALLSATIHRAWDFLLHLNPLAFIQTIFNLQRDAVERTSGVLASGILSVATGVSHLASRDAGNGIPSDRRSSSSLFFGRPRSNKLISEKMFRRLNRHDSTSKVISYIERENEVLTDHARMRVQRMMHYDVSLRPFVATVVAPGEASERRPSVHSLRIESFAENSPFPSARSASVRSLVDRDTMADYQTISVNTSANLTETNSPFMCTPKSFPPTPSSRSLVMARGTRFAEDVVFLARDQLRNEGNLISADARTRAMANALREGSRLAVFNAADTGTGIALTCGQHCATKVGNVLYCSTRSMVPVLRNCFVYFEMSVSPPAIAGSMPVASLSIGLSTLEMPLNTLVGAWKSSIGLCTTGQILTSGQWSSTLNHSVYGNNSTVGCLVRIDDDSAFQTWDGLMVNVSLTYNVNGILVTPPLTCSSIVRNRLMTQQHDMDGVQSGLFQDSTLRVLVPREEELYPTLTLHSPATQVMCRFCAEDLLAASRADIGAPRGVPVYASDGTLLFEENVDSFSRVSDDDSLEGSEFEEDTTDEEMSAIGHEGRSRIVTL